MTSKHSTASLASSVGKRVTLNGTARDAKGGAVIVAPSGEPVYVEGLDYWSPEFSGKQISATGVLREKKYIPDPLVTPDGAISQGAQGNQYVLENAQWRRI